MSVQKIADRSDLKPGEKKKIIIGTKEILLVNLEGKYYAIDNKCPHMGGDLSQGALEGKHIICPKHHAVFDVTDGKAVKDGKLLFVAAKVHDQTAYPLKIENDQILIELP